MLSSTVHRPCIYLYRYITCTLTQLATHIYIHFLTISYFNFRGLYSAIYVHLHCSHFTLPMFYVVFCLVFCPVRQSVVVSISAKCVLNRHLVGVGARLPSCFACGYTP